MSPDSPHSATRAPKVTALDAPPAEERPVGPAADLSVRHGAQLREVVTITKALADETRVRALLSLQRGELCVCQIVELVGLATSTMSKHMSILKHAGLVESRKDGRWMYYRLADDEAPEVVRRALSWVLTALAQDPQVLRDRQRIAAICNSDPSGLCAARKQGGCDCH